MAKTYPFVLMLLSCIGWSQRNSTPPSLTIYNQNFAVVRQTVPLQLKAGPNQVSFDEITSYVEPSSVMLRDPVEQVHLSILEQNYRSDAISQYTLLRYFEGKDVDFLVRNGDQQQTQHGRVIRAGTLCVPGATDASGSYCYADNSVHYSTEPIIELDGKLRFGLPGAPMFPSLGDAALLKPALDWTLQSDKTAQFNAELSYVTGGFTWEATYNVVTPSQGDLLDLVGWVTLQNRSGRSFEDARLQLMAGDVNKFVMPGPAMDRLGRAGGVGGGAYVMAGAVPVPQVTESTLDEYHLYSLQRPSTLLNGETKQVEFLRAANIPSRRIYVYEGYALDITRYPGGNWDYISQQRDIGLTTNKRVYVMREFRNSEADHLGIPLPKGRMRFYRRDSEGRMQFIGENTIEHTPKDETLRVYTGDAFDITAERVRTEFKTDGMRQWMDEAYQVKLRNHKTEAVEVQVVEHMYRGDNWAISANSTDYKKKDSHTAEFTAKLPPNGEQVLTYSVHYTW
jgi:hypothetical protein